MSHNNQIISAVRWLAFGRFAGQTISWIITILVMRILSPGDYGLVSMGATLIALIALISEFGFGTALIQAKDITPEQSASVFGAAILFGITSYILVAVISPLIGNFYNDTRVVLIIQLAGLTFILASLSTIPDAMLRRQLNFKKLSLIDFSSTLIGSVATYLLALLKFEYWALVIGPLIYSTSRTTLLHLTMNERILPSFRITPALQLVRFGGQIAISRLAGYAVTQTDVVFAGRYLGKEALGFYTVAIDLALMPLNKVMSIVNQIALPALAKTARERPEAKGEELLTWLRLIAYVVFPCLVGIAAIAQWLVPLLLGEKWHDVILPLQLIALASILRVIAVFVSTATISYGRADIEVKDRLTSAIIFPLCFLIGIQYGIIGLAASWFIALPIALAINLMRTKEAFGVGHRQILSTLLKPTLISMVMGAGTLAIGHVTQSIINMWVAILFNVVFSAALYASLLWFSDKNQAKLIIKSIRP